MSRLDRKRGRFDADFETNAIRDALTGWQGTVGTTVLYYRFVRGNSTVDDVYDEGGGALGRVYARPTPLPVLHVTHLEGGNENAAEGFYFNDTIYITAAYEQIRRMGLSNLDLQTQNYIRDRIVYDGRVFHITQMRVEGQIQDRDIMVAIEATQVKPDELVDDATFSKYAAGDSDRQ